MAQIFVRCRDFIDDGECSVTIGALSQEEVIEAAVEHACTTHAEEDTPTLRSGIRECLRVGAMA